MEVVKRIGELVQISDHFIGREAARPRPLYDLLEVPSLDPIHRDVVTVAFEEVVSNEREVRAGCQREEDVCLSKQLLALCLRANLAYLESNEATVLVVESLNDLALTPASDYLEELISASNEFHCGA
jgi:hypothetical protein